MRWRWIERREKNDIMYGIEFIQPEWIVRQALTASLEEVVRHGLVCLPQEVPVLDQELCSVPHPVEVRLAIGFLFQQMSRPVSIQRKVDGRQVTVAMLSIS